MAFELARLTGLLDPAWLSLEAANEVGNVAPKGVRDPAQGFERWVAHPTLDCREVGPVQARIERKALLAETELLSSVCDSTAENQLALRRALLGPGHPRI